MSTPTPAAIDRLLATLAHNPRFIVELIKAFPPNRLQQRPAPRKWSAHEHACHLAVVHQVMVDRLERMLKEDCPVFRPYLPEKDQDDEALFKLDIDTCLDSYVRERDALVTRLRALTPEQWARPARHPEYNAYSIYIMYRHIAMHDLLHGYRIEELLLAPQAED
jgi:hypothetical protein